MAGLGQRIEAPARGAVRRGLVASAPTLTFPAPLDEQANPPGGEPWLGGVFFEAGACDSLDPRPILCADLGDKGEQSSDGNPEWHPYYVMGADRCTTMDRGRPRVEYARRNLLATQSRQIESEVWDGVASFDAQTVGDPINPFLADGLATIVSASAVPFVNALAWLDHDLVDCLNGAQGMIHASVLTANLWYSAGLLRVDDGGRLLTVSDNIVVAGAGYSGSAGVARDPEDPAVAPVPPAAIDAAAWAYGTGLVYVALGAEDRIGQTEAAEIDRTTNTQVTRVERPAVAIWAPCCHLGINIDHTTEVG